MVEEVEVEVEVVVVVARQAAHLVGGEGEGGVEDLGRVPQYEAVREDRADRQRLEGGRECSALRGERQSSWVGAQIVSAWKTPSHVPID